MVTQFRILRGSVCWYDFGKPQGSEPAKRRPALVVQADAYNRSAVQTTMVVPMTSRLSLAEYDDNVFVPALASGLDKDSVALTFQVVTVNQSRLDYPVGQLPESIMNKIDRGLASTLGLSCL